MMCETMITKIETKEEIAEWLENIKQYSAWEFNLWESLIENELYSLMRSNRFPHSTRNMFFHFYMPHRQIRELIPVIAAVGIVSVIMDIVSETNDVRKGE